MILSMCMNSSSKLISFCISAAVMSLLLILISSCQSEQYRSKLEENEKLKSQLELVNNYSNDDLVKYIKSQLLLNPELYMDFSNYQYPLKLINNNVLGKVNQETIITLKFYAYREIDPEKLSYTIPSKNRNTYGQQRISTSGRYLSFIPKDTGMYYWSAIIEERNGRTGVVTEFFLKDSIYVFGN